MVAFKIAKSNILLLSLLVILLVISGCGSPVKDSEPSPFTGTTLYQRLFSAEITFRNPPRKGDWLRPQPHLVICNTEQLAITMALTGFFLDGCELLATEKTHKVESVTQRDFGSDQLVWMATVSAGNGIHWVPFPWHDWA